MSEALTTAPVAWRPQVGPQSDACRTAAFCDELFFGGAVFGGKSDLLLGDYASDLQQGQHWAGILFRQTLPELEDLIERSHQIYPYLGGHFLVGKNTWHWPNGPLLRMRHMDNEKDFQRYMGHSYAWIGWDELPNWGTMRPYKQMLSRLRGPAKDKRVRATGNPGGRCHVEIKEYFGIGQHRQGYKLITDPVSKQTRMFIPSRVADNVIGLTQDPGYLDRLEAVGDPELVKAWKEGDWDAVVGAYFSRFRRQDVLHAPFEIPEGWAVFSGGDYGEANPCWWGLFAVDYDDDVWLIDEYWREQVEGGAEHARGVKAMIDNCPYLGRNRVRLNLAPADMWVTRKPGEASQARAPQDSFAAEGLHLTRCNMDRVNGWRNCKDLLYANRWNFFAGRTDRAIESLASVERDPNNAEDVAKGGNDHPADGCRYVINHVYKPRKRAQTVDTPGTGENLLRHLATAGGRKKRYA